MIGILSTAEIEELLFRNLVGRIGCNDGMNTYVVPVNYVYDGKYIHGHSIEGMKVQIMRTNPRICFEVDEIINSSHWRSVIVLGEYQELTDERSRYDSMKLLVDKMLHVKIYEDPANRESIEDRKHPRFPGNMRSVIYRIIINEKTGRFENE